MCVTTDGAGAGRGRQLARRVGVVAVALLLAGCAGGSSTRVAGEDPCVATPLSPVPERVVVDHQRVAEVMAALGLAGRVVGVHGDLLTVPPADVADEVTAMHFLGGNPERPAADDAVAALDADVSIVTGSMPGAPTDGQVVRIGGACGDPTSIDDAIDEIVAVGRLFGVDDVARRVADREHARVDALRTAGPPATHPVVLTRAGDVTDPLRPVNGMIAEMVDLAGGRDVARGAADPVGAVRASDAEAFVVVGHASDQDPSGLVCTISLTVRDDLFRAFPDIPATGAGAAIVLPTAPSFGGLRVADDVEWLAGQLGAVTGT